MKTIPEANVYRETLYNVTDLLLVTLISIENDSMFKINETCCR